MKAALIVMALGVGGFGVFAFAFGISAFITGGDDWPLGFAGVFLGLALGGAALSLTALAREEP